MRGRRPFADGTAGWYAEGRAAKRPRKHKFPTARLQTASGSKPSTGKGAVGYPLNGLPMKGRTLDVQGGCGVTASPHPENLRANTTRPASPARARALRAAETGSRFSAR